MREVMEFLEYDEGYYSIGILSFVIVILDG
jgi:hypothetical protein